MALRLEQAGIRAFTVVTLPLQGRTFWRGQGSEIFWTASDAHLGSGETLDKVFATASEAQFLYIDPRREPVRLPSEDLSKMTADSFLFFRSGTPLNNHCGTR